jgi:hypothetical protein
VKVRVLVLLVAGALASSASAATQPAVPTFTQHQIAKRAPALAYVPARLPTGYRYYRWAYVTSPQPALRIWFRNPAKKEITFIASWRKGACTAGKQKFFQMAGNKVWWAQRAEEQEAWRCVVGAAGRIVQLTTATSQSPDQFADVGLARVTASGHRIR